MRLNSSCFGLVVTLLVGSGVALTGCGGAGSAEVTPFVGKTYSRMSVPLVGGAPGNLLLMVQKDGAISGNLIMNVTLPGAKEGADLQIAYHLSGTVNDSDGSFKVDFQNKPYKISGSLPQAPALSGGNFTVEASGKAYGPFSFGSSDSKSSQ